MIAALIAAIICMCGPAHGPYEQADRMNPPVTVPENPCDASRRFVDSLPYEWGNLQPVHQAYRSVAACLGWSPAVTNRWEQFLVEDVIKEESGGCWNVLRKAQWQGEGCNFSYPNGSAEDAGFFQLIGLWHGPDGYLCTTFGTCGRNAVIASPFESMRAGLRAVMHDGSRPWCYDARARSFHDSCDTVPRAWGAG